MKKYLSPYILLGIGYTIIISIFLVFFSNSDNIGDLFSNTAIFFTILLGIFLAVNAQMIESQISITISKFGILIIKVLFFGLSTLFTYILPGIYNQTLVLWSHLSFMNYLNIGLWLISIILLGSEITISLFPKYLEKTSHKQLFILCLAPVLSFCIDFCFFTLFDFLSVIFKNYTLFRLVPLFKLLLFLILVFLNKLKTTEIKQVIKYDVKLFDLFLFFNFFLIALGSIIALQFNLNGDNWRVLMGLEKFLQNEFDLYYYTEKESYYPIFWPAIVYINSICFNIPLNNTSSILNLFNPISFFTLLLLVKTFHKNKPERFHYLNALLFFCIGNMNFVFNLLGFSNFPFIFHFENVIVNILYAYNHIILYFLSVIFSIIWLLDFSEIPLGIEHPKITKEFTKGILIFALIGLFVHEIEFFIIFLLVGISLFTIREDSADFKIKLLEELFFNTIIILLIFNFFFNNYLLFRIFSVITNNRLELVTFNQWRVLFFASIFIFIGLKYLYAKYFSSKMHISLLSFNFWTEIKKKNKPLKKWIFYSLLIIISMFNLIFYIFPSVVKSNFSLINIFPSFAFMAFIFAFGLLNERISQHMLFVFIFSGFILLIGVVFSDFRRTRFWIYLLLTILLYSHTGLEKIKLKIKNSNFMKTIGRERVFIKPKKIIVVFMCLLLLSPGFLSNLAKYKIWVNNQSAYKFTNRNLILSMDYMNTNFQSSQNIITNYDQQNHPYLYLNPFNFLYINEYDENGSDFESFENFLKINHVSYGLLINDSSLTDFEEYIWEKQVEVLFQVQNYYILSLNISTST